MQKRASVGSTAPDDIFRPRIRPVMYRWRKIEVQEDPEASFPMPEKFIGSTTIMEVLN